VELFDGICKLLFSPVVPQTEIGDLEGDRRIIGGMGE
jgi:hypothetical protein